MWVIRLRLTVSRGFHDCEAGSGWPAGGEDAPEEEIRTASSTIACVGETERGVVSKGATAQQTHDNGISAGFGAAWIIFQACFNLHLKNPIKLTTPLGALVVRKS